MRWANEQLSTRPRSTSKRSTRIFFAIGIFYPGRLVLAFRFEFCIHSERVNLDSLTFAQTQIERIEAFLAAIGDITRFPTSKHLMGYAGLGARVHDSGVTRNTGGITKSGRRDLCDAMIQAARVAAKYDPHWRAELERLRKRMIYQKSLIARVHDSGKVIPP